MQITPPQLPEVGKIYVSNIPSAPEIAVRIKVESVLEITANAEYEIEASYIATCSFPDEPGEQCIELLPDEWAASGFSLEVR